MCWMRLSLILDGGKCESGPFQNDVTNQKNSLCTYVGQCPKRRWRPSRTISTTSVQSADSGPAHGLSDNSIRSVVGVQRSIRQPLQWFRRAGTTLIPSIVTLDCWNVSDVFTDNVVTEHSMTHTIG